MERIYQEIGLPLKTKYGCIETDPEILKKIDKEKEAEPSYNFLGISRKIRKNTVRIILNSKSPEIRRPAIEQVDKDKSAH